MTWSIDDYVRRAGRRQSHAGDSREEALLQEFPGIPLTSEGALYLQDESLLVTDARGTILMWYLPLVISESRQVGSISEYPQSSASREYRKKSCSPLSGSVKLPTRLFSPPTTKATFGQTLASSHPLKGRGIAGLLRLRVHGICRDAR
jgi:hypothetical protein